MKKILFFILICVIQISAQNNILSNQITVTFSEPMDSAGFRDGSIWTITRTDNNENIPVIGHGIDTTKQPMQGFTEFILVVYPNALQFGIEYKIEVAQGSVTDLAGNPIEGANTVWIITPYLKSELPIPNVGIRSPTSGQNFTLINSGSSIEFTDYYNRIWSVDYGFVAGMVVNRGAIPIEGTLDPEIYRTERYSMLGYNIGVPNGLYEVRLHFCETFAGITQAGQRVFSVNVEGTLISDIDIFAEAGGRRIALIRAVTVNVNDDQMDLSFIRTIQNPVINGIELERIQ
jgi:hypothetical protein